MQQPRFWCEMEVCAQRKPDLPATTYVSRMLSGENTMGVGCPADHQAMIYKKNGGPSQT